MPHIFIVSDYNTIQMDVVFLSQFSGINPRGAETFVYELGNRLQKSGFQVRVFQTGKALPGSLYSTIVIPQTHPASFTREALKKVTTTDIIFPLNGRWQALLASFWAKSHQTKLVISGQSGLGWDDRLNLLTFPDTFVGLTNYQSNWAKRSNPFVKTTTIANGIDLEKFKPQKSHLKIDMPHPIILNVGALTAIKRQDLLIKAVAQTQSRASLLIVGDGPEKSNLLKLGQKLLPGRLVISALNYQDMPKVYNCADVFCFPTEKFESFGIAILEALASNLPVVATDDPIRREIVGLGGAFVDPDNTHEFAQTLDSCISRDWGDVPRVQAQKYSWDKITQKYINLFKSI